MWFEIFSLTFAITSTVIALDRHRSLLHARKMFEKDKEDMLKTMDWLNEARINAVDELKEYR